MTRKFPLVIEFQEYQGHKQALSLSNSNGV